MSNSVVKVTDSMLNDSLLLLVGEDGTVTPNKETVKSYLNSKNGATEIQVMHINKTDGQSIDVSIDNVTYLPDKDSAEPSVNMKEVSKILVNIKLDHDYTSRSPSQEDDELAKTLSLLDGDSESDLPTQPTCHLKSKKVTINKRTKKPLKSPKKLVKKIEQDNLEEEKSEDDFEEDEEDSDYELDEETLREKTRKKPRIKSRSSKTQPKKEPTSPKAEPVLSQPIPQTPPLTADKKLIKKDKKPKPPILDDFALFSTPDIIRRVGKDQPTTPTTPDDKPNRIEGRSKSLTADSPTTPRARSIDDSRVNLRKRSTDNKTPITKKANDSRKSVDSIKMETMDQIDYSQLMNNESNNDSSDQAMNLDSNPLDLDPALLDNINNDLISEDILYQVAQSLVSNTELQNAIDKSLNEGNLVLDPALMEQQESVLPQQQQQQQQQQQVVQELSPNTPQKGTQIVRPDGRIVLIPPIERPTTRSRNKKKDLDINLQQQPSLKFTHKPLDEEHVSGNELDSSGNEDNDKNKDNDNDEDYEDEEEESEDDPNKLWCICNQPHNNRFMICCDSCEEWYHGKCVNITKAMGQQMELEGKDWICIYCKDPAMKRPSDSKRRLMRLRKTSRNSRQSSDSGNGSKITEKIKKPNSTVPCVVCQKPSRTNSIFCSETCILQHAQGVERVVVFERATGNMLTGNKAPSASNLEMWLKQNPGYEVVRSAGKVVTTKTQQQMTQSKLKLIKNSDNNGVSLAVHKKGVNVGVLKHLPKNNNNGNKKMSSFKIVSKQVSTNSNQKVKLLQPNIVKNNQQTQQKLKMSPSLSNNSKNVNIKDKPMPVKTPKARQAETTITPQQQQPKQENIRDTVQKTIYEQLLNRLKMVDDLKLTNDEIKLISLEIESQLYKCFGDTGQKYRNKYRSLIFNIKDIKNQTLWRRICEKTINPYQLVRLSPDDMASQELALWRERETKHQLDMIKKSELELLNCNRQYVLKTHKGEEVLEDNRPSDTIIEDNTEVITSLTDNPEKDNKKQHKEHKTNKDKKRSRSHDRSRRRSRSRGGERHKKSSSSSHKKHKKEHRRGSSTDKLDKKSKEILEQLVDNKIVPPLEDRLWKHGRNDEEVVPADSDSDHEPTSTVTIPTPPRSTELDEEKPVKEEKKKEKIISEKEVEAQPQSVSPPPQVKLEEIWRGCINMIDVAQISITAHRVSGDCNGLTTELPKNLDIVGRISPDTVWDYIGKMKCSNSKIISLVRLSAVNSEEKMPYLALYSYLSSRNRLGVVKSTNKAVKDFYILPLAAQKPIPQALLPINGPGFEEQRPALLLGIIIRDKRRRPSDNVTAHVTKKIKVELITSTTSATATTTTATGSRSYTPPPVKDMSKLKLPLPPAMPGDDDEDEPYSPGDSDPENAVTPTKTEISATFQPFTNKFDDIPGLGNPVLPSNAQEIERQMEEINKKIEMQKSEINSISQNIGSSALADITLPSNLLQILDSIKVITTNSDTPETEVTDKEQTDLTIPLMLPNNFTRPLSKNDTIPLNLPSKQKKAEFIDKAGNSVLSTLSEEELIRKAAEMLGETKKTKEEKVPFYIPPPSMKKSKLDLNQPPVPGLED